MASLCYRSFQTMKIPKYTFCRRFNSEYEQWHLLWWRHWATLPLKSSHKEQPSVIRLLWAKGLGANAIQSEMRPLYGDKYFTRPAIHVWCKKFAHGRENVADMVTVLFGQPVQRSQQSIPSCGQTGLLWDKCLHEFGHYVENETLMFGF